MANDCKMNAFLDCLVSVSRLKDKEKSLYGELAEHVERASVSWR